ncbi:MAG: stage III sporulation protein AD [Ruminococcaceae bacterium]|nr:stage III sporulation protein AD [Oscillospiraceae bacterium]
METLVKVAGLCLAAAVMALLLKKSTPELGFLLAGAAVLLGCILLLRGAAELAELWEELTGLTALAPALFTPLVKVTAIALVTRFGTALCDDAGQSALARVMETAGAFCALGCAIPLLREVVEMVRGWTGA